MSPTLVGKLLIAVYSFFFVVFIGSLVALVVIAVWPKKKTRYRGFEVIMNPGPADGQEAKKD